MAVSISRQHRRLIVLLFVGLAARLALQQWDSGLLSPHPDERQVAFVAEKLNSWFGNPGFFAYGSLHFQAVRAVAMVGSLPLTYAGLLVAGRTLSMFASLCAMLLAWWLARRAWGRRSADLTLVFIALCPLDLQLSHFATVEAHHALWVLLTLTFCFITATRQRPAAAMVMGLAAGFSVAVKIASLPLGLSLALALLIAASRTSWRRATALAAIAAAAFCFAFWLGQPSAFAGMQLAPAYLQGVGEQVAMVSGSADLPYVRVYNGTLPVFYPARELASWAFGPALALAAFGAVLAGLVMLWRRKARLWHGQLNEASVLVVLLLTWIVPMSIRLATLHVKFVRYWEPLAVPLCLLAAWWLVRLPKRLRRPLITITAATTLAWGLAYLWAFTAPHPHHTAARWLDRALETDQIVAFEHWDEGLRLNPWGGSIRTTSLESYDLPDGEPKTRRWCTNLAAADWVVLTSHRVRRTVMANPERFARTARLYELLLSGEAGFEAVARCDRGPRLFGFRSPVRWIQRADESIVNYDFPRVVILRRTGTTDVEALVAAAISGPTASFADSERRLVDPLPTLPHRPGAAAQVVCALTWVIFFAGTGFAIWALFLPLLRWWADGGLALALVSAWILCGWLMWFLSEAGLVRTGENTAAAIAFALFASGAIAARRRWATMRRLVARRRHQMTTVLGFSFATWLFFLLVRLFNPAVHWGEKPMDFAFLNAFLRAENWPPGEPWMAGEVLNYYYFGDVLAAFPILATGTVAAIGYNLVAATVPALTAGVLAAIGLTFAQRRQRGLLIPALVLFTGNLAWPFLLDLARDRRWFDLWWATSRVIPGFAIEEYPLWTAVFADLHGHFLALPVVFAGLGWAWTCLRAAGRRSWVPAAFMCGLSAGVLAGCNPWDIPLFAATLALTILTVAARPWRGFLRLATAAAFSLLAAAPFLVELQAWMQHGSGGNLLTLNAGGMAPAWAIGRHLGLFLIPLAVLALTRLGRDVLIAAPMAGLAVYGALSFDSSAAALALAAAALFFTVLSRSADTLQRLAWALAGLAMMAVAFCERFTIIDRMNTIFKLYNSVWWLLATALVLALLSHRGWRRRILLVVWLPLQIVAALNLPLAVAQGWLQPRMHSPRPTLDGQAFLAAHDRQTLFLSQTLLGVAGPDDVLLEAAGDPYRHFTRLAMHTGVSTVVGWEHHLFQRGHARQAIHSRQADVMAFYTTDDPTYRRLILDRYEIDWIALADVERNAYSLRTREELDSIPGVVRFAAFDGAVLYRVGR